MAESRVAVGNAGEAGTDQTALTNLTWLVAKALGWTRVGQAACSFSPETWGRWLGTPPKGRAVKPERCVPSFVGTDLGAYVPDYAKGECLEEAIAWLRERHVDPSFCGTPREVCELLVNQAIAHGVFK